MKLTGECKKAFENWCINEEEFTNDFNEFHFMPSKSNMLVIFSTLTPSMQYGVMVDFFDSEDIILDIQPVLDYDLKKYTKVCYWIFTVFTLDVESTYYNELEFKSRQEAQTEAILKANEIFNNK